MSTGGVIFAIGGALPLAVVPLIVFLRAETRPARAPAATHRIHTALFGKGQAAPTVLLWLASLLTILFLYLMLNWLPSLVVAKGFSPGDGASAALALDPPASSAPWCSAGWSTASAFAGHCS